MTVLLTGATGFIGSRVLPRLVAQGESVRVLIRPATLACGTGGCETVQTSPFSRFLGLEVALYGVVGYLVLLVLSMDTLRRPLAGISSRLLLILSGTGLAFTIYLTYLELFVIKAICRWCVGSAVIITLIFIVALLDWRRRAALSGSLSQSATAPRQAARRPAVGRLLRSPSPLSGLSTATSAPVRCTRSRSVSRGPIVFP